MNPRKTRTFSFAREPGDSRERPRPLILHRWRRLLLVTLAILWLGLACSIATPPSIDTGDVDEKLFDGVVYARIERDAPRKMVIHKVEIDLRAPGIRTLVTPGDPDRDLPLDASLTTEFLENYGLQIALNGDAFEPWHSRTILDYYPHSGDPVDVIGIAASEGIQYSDAVANTPTLYLNANNKARFGTPVGKLYNAISGTGMLIRNGKTVSIPESAPEPRSAIGLNRSEKVLILVVVDGRQPGYSEGVTLQELASLLLEFEVFDAMNLDGGGSSTLVMEDARGAARILNQPIDANITGRERVVANHLGIYAKPKD